MNALDKDEERWTRLLDVLKRCTVAKHAAPGAREDAKKFALYQETR
jgi:hypothetical protein